MKIIFACLGLLAVFSVRADIPLTRSNLKGQEKLWNEGWEIILSPKEAWKMALSNSETSHAALKRALLTAQRKTQDEGTKARLESALKTMGDVNEAGKSAQVALNKKGTRLGKELLANASVFSREALEALTLGYVHYFSSNQEDFEAIKKLNQDFLLGPGKNIDTTAEMLGPMREFFIGKSEVEWMKYFEEGQHAFEEQYQKSGARTNSMSGTWDILLGYLRLAWSSLKPGGAVIGQAVKGSVYYTTSAVLNTAVISHHIVYSLGANLYYVTKLGVKVVSPSLEASYLAALSMASAAGALSSKGALASAGIINRVALTAAAPAAGAGQFVLAEAGKRAEQAVTYLVYGSLGASEVALEKIESGVVLGYSALSQLPPQVLLSAVNASILLVYEGPRLVLVKAKNFIAPAGMVLDVKKLKTKGVEVEAIPAADQHIDSVLKAQP